MGNLSPLERNENGRHGEERDESGKTAVEHADANLETVWWEKSGNLISRERWDESEAARIKQTEIE